MIKKTTHSPHKNRYFKSPPTDHPESPKDSHSLIFPQSSFSRPTTQQAPLYSVKYLGITKGQIGILSKRSPIPYLSPLETCKDIPMNIINTSLSDRKTSSRLINRLINMPNTVQILTESSFEKNELPETEENFPVPEMYDEKVIHTYARPKGLISIKKEVSEPGIGKKSIVIPYNRVGVSGWKLSRPKTAKSVTASREMRNRTVVRRKRKEIQRDEVFDFMDEPYLKYLMEKRNS